MPIPPCHMPAHRPTLQLSIYLLASNTFDRFGKYPNQTQRAASRDKGSLFAAHRKKQSKARGRKLRRERDKRGVLEKERLRIYVGGLCSVHGRFRSSKAALAFSFYLPVSTLNSTFLWLHAIHKLSEKTRTSDAFVIQTVLLSHRRVFLSVSFPKRSSYLIRIF